MIPYLLGFEPSESLVIVSLGGPRRRLGPIVRGDLGGRRGSVDPGTLADYLTNVAGSRGYDAVLVVAYSTQPETAGAAVSTLLSRLADTGVAVHEALRADGSRWWSYSCDRGCCPADGTPYDPTTTAAAALAVAMGLTKEQSRDDLAAQFAPLPTAERAIVSAEARAVAASPAESPARWDHLEELILSSLASSEVARSGRGVLLGAVQDLDARDLAWVLMSRESASRHFELWRDVMRAADDDLLAPAGTLCAFAAWLSGGGALAATAVERVAAIQPNYPFLGLICDILSMGLSPDRWEELRGPLAGVVGYISAGPPSAGGVAGDAAG
jgi:Domain of unknown function (DUF4192)